MPSPKAVREMGGTGRLVGGTGVRQTGSLRRLLAELGHEDQGWEERLGTEFGERRGGCSGKDAGSRGCLGQAGGEGLL